jgi:hypothetical protein
VYFTILFCCQNQRNIHEDVKASTGTDIRKKFFYIQPRFGTKGIASRTVLNVQHISHTQIGNSSLLSPIPSQLTLATQPLNLENIEKQDVMPGLAFNPDSDIPDLSGQVIFITGGP